MAPTEEDIRSYSGSSGGACSPTSDEFSGIALHESLRVPPEKCGSWSLEVGDDLVEVDKPGLCGFIKNGKSTGNPRAPASCFPPPRLLIHEHHVGVNLRRERDRLALARVEVPLARDCSSGAVVHLVLFQERIHLRPSFETKKPAKLSSSEGAGPVRFKGQTLKRCAGKILPLGP